MSLFKRKQKENKIENQTQNQNQNKDTNKDTSKDTSKDISKDTNKDNTGTQPKEDTSTDEPNTKFTMYLLMKEHCLMPQPELITQVFSKHIDNSHLDTYNEMYFEMTADNYQFEIEDELFCPHFFVTNCKPLEGDPFDYAIKNHLRNETTKQIVDDCKYHVTALDALSNHIADYKQRASLLMDYLEALMELYPTCEAVMFESSGKIITRDFIVNSQCNKEDRFVNYTANVRLFFITDTDYMIVDSTGLQILGLPDLQYRFKDLDPNLVMAHACLTLGYIFENNMPIRDGDTIDSVKGDEMVCQELQWRCRYQVSQISPERLVIDVDTSEYIPLNKD